MKRRSPPWGAIEAFVCAGRSRSFRHAAEQLGLSPPAFSRRILALEHHVGVRLFHRGSQPPRLTAAGERYLERLQPGYEALREATSWMAPDSSRRPLRLGVSQSMAVSWLVPRLARFYTGGKGMALIVQTRGRPRDLIGGDADLGILYGSGAWRGLITQRLFSLEAVVVAAPALASKIAPDLESLLRQPLLDLVEPPNLWHEWLARAGHKGPVPAPRLVFEGVHVLYEAAARGLGIALGVQPLVDPFLADGRLAVALDRPLPLPGSYFLAATPEMRHQRSVQTLWTWLIAEAKRSARPVRS
jgi:LysR family glycine cleavage system transcriptional activator